ncbi:MAG: hypothetical protein AAGA84_08700, partial [Pseudomonadota bacterium]
AGQGANLGFSDAAALAASLQLALARREDVGDAPVLRRFRRARKADNVTTLHGLDLINRLFARADGPLAALRQRGMRWFDALPALKQLAASHAMRREPLPMERRR